MSNKLEARIKNYHSIQRELKPFIFKPAVNLADTFKKRKFYNSECIAKDVLAKSIHIKSLAGTPSKHADILFAELTDKLLSTPAKNGIGLVVKKSPLNYTSLFSIGNKIDSTIVKETELDALNEIYFLELIRKLLLNKITNFLPFLYTYYICDSCKFYNKYVNKQIQAESYIPFVEKSPCVYLITEKAGGDLEHFIKKKSTTKKQLFSGYLQIFIALYVIKKYFGIEHNDLHLNNVLYFNVKPGGYWKYRIKNKTIYVPNYGTLFVLWDFGYSFIPGKVEYLENTDVYRKINKKGPPHPFPDFLRVSEGITSLNKKFRGVSDFLYTALASSKNIIDLIIRVYDVVIYHDRKLRNHYENTVKNSVKSTGKTEARLNIIETFNTNKKLK